jgi:hypothetical protein
MNVEFQTDFGRRVMALGDIRKSLGKTKKRPDGGQSLSFPVSKYKRRRSNNTVCKTNIE